MATKHDLAELEERMELRFQRQDEHIDARMHAEINRLLLFLFPTMLSGLGLAAVIGRIAADLHASADACTTRAAVSRRARPAPRR